MVMKFSLQSVLEIVQIVILNTSSAAYDKNVTNMSGFVFPW